MIRLVIEPTSGLMEIRSTHTTVDRDPGERVGYSLSLGPTNPRWWVQPAPRDLTRSRSTGMSRTVCASCGAARDQGHTHHTANCTAESGATQWRRETTGPMTPRQTSRDAGWS